MIAAALIAALIGCAGMLAAGLAWGPDVLVQGYLAALVTVEGIPLGCLLFLLTEHLLPSRWSFRLDPALEAAALTLPLVGLAFIPIVTDLGRLYAWAPHPVPWPAHWPRARWLSPDAFAVRTLLYFVLLSGLAILGATRTRGERRPTLAGPGLVALTMVATFAAFDWLMSLEPAFHSTIFGIMVLADQTLGALAFLCLAGLSLPPVHPETPPPVSGLGATLVSLLLLWAYLGFMQYLVIWSGNLPNEISWFLHRIAGGWTAVVWVIWVPLGLLPFLILMQGRYRRSREGLMAASALILVMRAVQTAWWVLPTWESAVGGRVLAALASLAALGGLWLAAFLMLLGRRRRLARSVAPEAMHG